MCLYMIIVIIIINIIIHVPGMVPETDVGGFILGCWARRKEESMMNLRLNLYYLCPSHNAILNHQIPNQLSMVLRHIFSIRFFAHAWFAVAAGGDDDDDGGSEWF